MDAAAAVRTEDFDSAPEFLDALRRSHPRWQGNTRSESDWIFFYFTKPGHQHGRTV